MRYFDCFIEIGPRWGKDPAAPWNVNDALRWMDHCGISGGLAMHTMAIKDDPVNARKRLAEDIARAPGRLFPVWVPLPPGHGDFENTTEDFIDCMKAEDVRAVKLYPAAHNYPFRVEFIGDLFAQLERNRILTLIDIDQLPAGAEGLWSGLSPVLERFPELPVLLQKTRWNMQRVVIGLMDRYPNLHIEFSSYQISRGVEAYVNRFGADQLLFGSCLTAMSAGAARTYIDYAQIPAEAKEKIAGGNLTRLLGGLTPADAPALKPDPLRDRAAAGQPLDHIEILDAHCHILHEGGEGAGAVVMYRGDADGLVEGMDIMGVNSTAIMSWAGPLSGDPVESNDIVARAIKKHPGRFMGVAYISPTHLSPDELMAEVRLRVEEQDFVGFKPYLHIGLRYDHPQYKPCWEYMNKRGMYALLHLGGSAGGTDVVIDLARTYPDAQWVIAHSGGSYGMARQVVAAMKEAPNIWAELTLTPVTNGVIEMMVSEVGDDRILFGTDAPMRDPRQQFGWVVWADLPVESREKILGKNFRRLLNMRRS